MSDIVERLRTSAVSSDPEIAFDASLTLEAADEIERLREVVKDAHSLLKEYNDEAAFDALEREMDEGHDP